MKDCGREQGHEKDQQVKNMAEGDSTVSATSPSFEAPIDRFRLTILCSVV